MDKLIYISGNRNIQATMQTMNDMVKSIQEQKQLIVKLVGAWKGEVSLAVTIAQEVKRLIEWEQYLTKLHEELKQMIPVLSGQGHFQAER